MSWEAEIEELRRREALAERMGGTEKVERQKSRGKLTIRERIELLVDSGSFHEIGKISGKATYDDDGVLVEFMPANFIFGRAAIDARPIIIAGDDFTVRGGAADASIYGKQIMAEKLANEIIDAANERGESVKKREDTHRMADANKAFAHFRW